MTYAVVGKFAKRKGVEKDKYKTAKVGEPSLSGLLVCEDCGYQEMRANSGSVRVCENSKGKKETLCIDCFKTNDPYVDY